MQLCWKLIFPVLTLSKSRYSLLIWQKKMKQNMLDQCLVEQEWTNKNYKKSYIQEITLQVQIGETPKHTKNKYRTCILSKLRILHLCCRSFPTVCPSLFTSSTLKIQQIKLQELNYMKFSQSNISKEKPKNSKKLKMRSHLDSTSENHQESSLKIQLQRCSFITKPPSRLNHSTM